MGFRMDRQSGRCHLALHGVVDVSEARELHEQALAALGTGDEVIVRLDEVERLDTSALQILVALAQGLKAEGRRLAITGIPPGAREAFRLSGLDAFLDVGQGEIRT